MSDAINPDHYKRLPAEAIEIIEASIDKDPSNQDAYLHGQVLKYVLRCWNKNGIEDLRKAKWYLDRLIDSFDEIEAEQLATVEVTGEVTGEVKPPDGWRWLEVGEVIREGDTDTSMLPIPRWWIGEVCGYNHDLLRRNRFEVGEKVVDFCGQVWEVEYIFDTGNRYRLKHKEVRDERYGNSLAPYFEDAK